ncbi:hypothetical protein TPER_HE00027 [Candidatus Hoaglandella endobia]|uniref:Uncharacterized protein n=1 Tax=Candidatus Hoaglandella endobia TaxID=1778263 RepID=A0A143WT90_9ENTR|nr:hypothetical protein TPER_HE00027 [Candidatus Hoaglandella endobia]
MRLVAPYCSLKKKKIYIEYGRSDTQNNKIIVAQIMLLIYSKIEILAKKNMSKLLKTTTGKHIFLLNKFLCYRDLFGTQQVCNYIL